MNTTPLQRHESLEHYWYFARKDEGQILLTDGRKRRWWVRRFDWLEGKYQYQGQLARAFSPKQAERILAEHGGEMVEDVLRTSAI